MWAMLAVALDAMAAVVAEIAPIAAAAEAALRTAPDDGPCAPSATVPLHVAQSYTGLSCLAFHVSGQWQSPAAAACEQCGTGMHSQLWFHPRQNQLSRVHVLSDANAVLRS